MVVALSMHSDRRYVHRMLHAGASAYLLKECAFHELVGAIREVLNGDGYYFSAGLSRQLADAYVRHLGSAEPVAEPISSREREVLQLVSEGKCTKEVAASLHVSVKTVETHRRHLMTKLNLHSIAELTKYAVREGITTLES
jgi:DNA-binding NarL/FixJ family response regulator